ncbi:MAG TPA: hypothetical protein VIE69_04770 [Methylophilaceae bacterium]|jgi:hypothetical protein
MTTFVQSLKESLSSTDAYNLMDMLSLGYDAYAETGSAALTLNTIVAIPDIYANSALLKKDPARAYSSAAEDFAPASGRKLDFIIS